MAEKPEGDGVAIACALSTFVVLFGVLVYVSYEEYSSPLSTVTPPTGAPVSSTTEPTRSPAPTTFYLTPVPLAPESSVLPVPRKT